MSQSKQPAHEDSFHAATWPLKLIYKVLMYLLMSWLACIAVGLYFHYQVYGESYAASKLLQVYQSVLTDTIDTQSERAAFIEWAGNRAYTLAFEWTGLDGLLSSFAHAGKPEGLDGIAYNFVASHLHVVQSVMLLTQIWGAKIALLLTSLPLFLLAYAVALVDGLVLRYIRREGGGRESAYIHHRSKHVATTLGGLFLMLVLAIPIQVQPRVLLPFAALVVGVLARIQWQYYKKYL